MKGQASLWPQLRLQTHVTGLSSKSFAKFSAKADVFCAWEDGVREPRQGSRARDGVVKRTRRPMTVLLRPSRPSCWQKASMGRMLPARSFWTFLIFGE